ncbi:ATP-binding protein [Synechococcus sp. RedBA-s]|uniref:ATP-binding protein n=1 Tax=Synechococcus sp. RedBA-s TaxID=2823741 RepID=UPI0020CCE8FF|nr:ATP-binding protein [Synechococcus sp. RedBA-s]MCP9799557.1 ATP-binding protein [Synechococcus sp. RedBA-s]
MASGSPIHRESFLVPSQLDGVGEVLARFERLRSAQINDSLWVEGQTALMEGFSNAVRHAHRDLSPPPPVAIDLSRSSVELRIQIDDHGPGYDMEEAWRRLDREQASHDYDPLEREAHWGMVLLRQLQRQRGWQITYQRRGEQGCRLTISHRIDLLPSQAPLGADNAG